MKRVFVSVELPEYVKDEILRIQKEIDFLGLIRGKFIDLDNLHLTLKFLGELSDTEIIAVKERLNRMKFEPFEVELRDLGVFSEDFVRIIWVSVEQGEIFDLQKRVDRVLKDLFLEEYRFMGHITITRPKSVEQRKMLLNELKKINFNKLKFKVDKVYLKESKLSSNGAQYKDLLEVSSVSGEQMISI